MVEDLKEKADEMEKARTEKPSQEPAPASTGEGNKSKTDEEIERINADTQRLKKAIAENEEAKALARLSGRTEAGQEIKEETQEEKDKVLIDRMLRTFS